MTNQAAQTMPERAYMTRDEALKIARACAYAKCHTHDYLPRTAQEAADWQPHEWVLDAIRWNALSQTAGVPEGWKLVPVEPTPEMLAAWRGAQPKGYGTGLSVKAGYRAMLAAAPAARGVDTSTNEAWAARAQEKIATMDAASGGEDDHG